MDVKPTVGRIVHYYVADPGYLYGMTCHDLTKPMAAEIAYVWSDTCVNLAVIDHNGNAHKRTSVQFGVTAGALTWADWPARNA